MLWSKVIGLFAILIATNQAYDPDFVCLGDDAAKITFGNRDGDVLVPDLYQVRVMTGGYASQNAVNYAAYMFMREKLGINVTWYPTTDYDTYWSYYSDGCGYPSCYWFWLEQDRIDVQFELWPTQEAAADAYSYYADGSVVDGFVGVYGEMGWYMPKYFTEEHPTAVVPEVLKTDATIRELLLNGSKYMGSKDWTAYYATRTGARNYSTKYDLPTGTKPIVWGSSETYTMSTYSYNLTRKLAGGLDFEFATTAASGETALIELVSDLYAARAPMLVNIYVPDDNFAITDELTGKFQQWERVALPRNPDQTVDDPCFVNATCAYPIEPIKKAANKWLNGRFPEAYEFFQGFNMPFSQLSQIINNFMALENTTLDKHQKWLNASCEWLKNSDSESTWNNTQWMVEIDRTDCIPGCGYADTNGDYQGGTCDYFNAGGSENGTCNCDYDELWGDYCTESCDGLKGPFEYMGNDPNASDWYFQFCSGHGTCDTEDRVCTCDEGYGDSGCGTKYSKYVFPLGILVVVVFFSTILAICATVCMFWLRLNKQYKTVKALSVDMTTLFTIGLICLTLSNIVLVLPVSNATCILWQLFFGMGGIMSIMSPLLKAYRVSRVFHGGKMLRAVKITDKMLMNTLLKAAGLELCICVAYSICHQLFGGTVLHRNHDDLRNERQCNDDPITNYVSMGSYAYFFVMLCALSKYSYGTRRALSVFKESTCAYSSSALSMFCTLITFVFYLATSDPTFRNTVQAFAVIVVVSAVLGLFYATRMYVFYTQPENRNVTDTRAPTYTATSTSMQQVSSTSTPQNTPQNTGAKV